MRLSWVSVDLMLEKDQIDHFWTWWLLELIYSYREIARDGPLHDHSYTSTNNYFRNYSYVFISVLGFTWTLKWRQSSFKCWAPFVGFLISSYLILKALELLPLLICNSAFLSKWCSPSWSISWSDKVHCNGHCHFNFLISWAIITWKERPSCRSKGEAIPMPLVSNVMR